MKKVGELMKQKKNGFTLVEVLGILVLLAILVLIVTTVITRNVKDSKQKMREEQLQSIELAAKNWATNHLEFLPENPGKYSYVSVGTLKLGGYIDDNLLDPVTNKCIPNDVQIKITKVDEIYVYTIQNKDSINYGNNCSGYDYDINPDDEDDDTIPPDSETDNSVVLEPLITIEVSTNTIKKDDIVTFVITSTEKELDYSKMQLKHEYLEDFDEESLGQSFIMVPTPIPSPVENGYEFYVDVQGGKIYENIWLEIGEGAVTNTAGVSSKAVASNKVVVDNEGPKVILHMARTECNSGKCDQQLLMSNEYFNMTWEEDNSFVGKPYNASYNIVMEIEDDTEYFEVTRFSSQGSELMGNNMSKQSIIDVSQSKNSESYLALLQQIYGDDLYASFYTSSNSTGVVSYTSISKTKYIESIYQNGQYGYSFCDANYNCSGKIELGDITYYVPLYNSAGEIVDYAASKAMINEEDVSISCNQSENSSCFITITNKYNDFGYPIIANASGSSKLKDYWKDNETEIVYSGAFVMNKPSSNQSYLDYEGMMYSHYFQTRRNWSQVESELKTQGIIVFNGNTYADETVSSLTSKARSQLLEKNSNACGAHYLWFVGIDKAGNLSFNSHEISLPTCYSNDSTSGAYYYPSPTPAEDGNSCGTICQMEQNSDAWQEIEEEIEEKYNDPNYGPSWFSYSQEAFDLLAKQKALHEQNLELCAQEPRCANYDTSTGVYYTENGTPLYDLEDEPVSW